MSPTLRSLKITLITLSAAALLASCGSSKDDNFDDRVNLAEPKTRFIHAIPAGPTVTLYRNGVAEPWATNADYKFGSQYHAVARQQALYSLHTVSGDREVAAQQIDAQRGRKYSLVVLPSSTGVELLTIDDPYSKSLTSDKARVRILNAAPNATNIDVYLTATAVDLATIEPTFSGVGYKQVSPTSGSNSIELEGNSYQLRITAAGTKSSSFSATVAVPKNGDWLLVTLAESGAAILRPNDIRVLLVRADDSDKATDELLSQ
jgi:Domain of unknown function (DUF4397)